MNPPPPNRDDAAGGEPISATNCTRQFDDGELKPTDPSALIPWSAVTGQLAHGRTWWFATNRPTGRPHVRPVLAVWVNGVLVTAAGAGTRKARNLADDSPATLTTSLEGIDLVVEGEISTVTDDGSLQRVADAFFDTYGWPTTVVDGALEAPYGAPSAGPPPYRVFAVSPQTVFAFGTDERWATSSTRFAFSAPT